MFLCLRGPRLTQGSGLRVGGNAELAEFAEPEPLRSLRPPRFIGLREFCISAISAVSALYVVTQRNATTHEEEWFSSCFRGQASAITSFGSVSLVEGLPGFATLWFATAPALASSIS